MEKEKGNVLEMLKDHASPVFLTVVYDTQRILPAQWIMELGRGLIEMKNVYRNSVVTSCPPKPTV